ncbi:hypothetical protein AVEN_19153-1 [Araneus ventricosus]|uniref:Uncharacterized protein n=1 Tax=Araneus ventricosus TaxID=182803 RepID=A0A4Y2PSK3_ARAVE|nr:hypothetical protein AVEN_19153-1 [Araneus ventricosus]
MQNVESDSTQECKGHTPKLVLVKQVFLELHFVRINLHKNIWIKDQNTLGSEEIALAVPLSSSVTNKTLKIRWLDSRKT